MNEPLVSVIVPNYNHAPYLRERIDSILNQTFQDFELILLDDCSPDNSREIINSYKDNPHVSHIVLNEENSSNTFVQWERGIKLAQGKYIWIAESDDVAKPNLLETLINELRATPGAVVAFSHSQMIDSNSQPMSLTWHPKGSSGKVEVYDGQWFLRHKMLVKNHIYNASMVVFKKSAYSKMPNKYQQYRYCGDWMFWNYLCVQGQVIEVCRQLNLYRQHERKVTVDSQKDGRKWRDIAGVLLDLSEMMKLNKFQRRCLRGRWTKRLNKEDNNHELDCLRTEFRFLFGGTAVDMTLYEIGKLLGFLKAM